MMMNDDDDDDDDDYDNNDGENNNNKLITIALLHHGITECMKKRWKHLEISDSKERVNLENYKELGIWK